MLNPLAASFRRVPQNSTTIADTPRYKPTRPTELSSIGSEAPYLY
jgi:hypothetical protein